MYRFLKRLIDIILSLVSLILLSPLFLLIAVWIKLDSSGPVLFCQKRIGINLEPFIIYKFRSMTVDTPQDTPTHLLQGSKSHITKSGRFLRKLSLDELPQLANILKGEMSLVGPRPALWNQFDLIEERERYSANSIRPGLTGWAQVNGRDELPIPDKAKLDGEYVRKVSFIFDLQIIFKTVLSVIKTQGIKEGTD